MNLKIFKNSKYPNGFTLAEVLITLVIIGIIAVMTIPTLMKNTQKQEFVTALKKAQSTLQNALVSMAKENDSSPGDYSFLRTVRFVDELEKVANVIKKCNNSEQCFGTSLRGGGVYKYPNNTLTYFTDGRSAVLADGQFVSYCPLSSSDATYGISDEDKSNAIIRIVMDINGNKSPNVVGRDVFYFYVVNGKGIVPAGSENFDDCIKTGSCLTCAGKVLKENAMNY